ncbi:MAG TPA: response regulator transcription factor [Anaerolineae bacterium]|nr:response regulator transcription factor [Anaerolineae bacterium]
MTATIKGSPIRILLVDDHRLFRQGLREICETKGGFKVVGEAENGRRAVDLANLLQPDVILMDIQMPELNGIQATSYIIENVPLVRVIMLTMFRQDEHVFEAIKAGARGYLLKDADWQEVVEAIYAVHRGEAIINPALAARLLDEFRESQSHKPKPAPPAKGVDDNQLTTGEMDVLQLVAAGLDNKEIADQLIVTEKTVTNRLSSLYKKLHLNNRTQAALYALRQGWTTLDPPK